MAVRQKNNTLMKKIITYFLIIIFFMGLLNAYSSFRYKSFYGNVYTMLKRLVDIYSVTLQVDKIYQNVDSYAHSGSRDYIEQCDREFDTLNGLVGSVRDSSSDENEYYVLIDLQNMIQTYDESIRQIRSDYDSKIQQVYVEESLVELGRLKSDINNEAKNILLNQLNPILSYYESFSNEIAKRERMIYLLTALITMACIVIAYRFSRGISSPIHQLVLRLQKVAKGQFESSSLELKTNDEINVLIESFNFMTSKIKEQIEEIKAKADLEKELKEQQIENLEMINLLHQSELLFLQSQINPHFLYNTMNTIAALATIENADRTKKMIECLTDMLKYNVKKINENVTLMEEYKIIQDYLYIQQARFGSRIEYRLSFDSSVMEYYVPSMILQPFVENAIIHGLEPKESQGLLEVRIEDGTENILVSITDNGVGMPEETLGKLAGHGEKSLEPSTHGIGIANVLRRLELKYGRNVVSIKSELGRGTEVRIELPKAV
jgi:sensor histidine kinase YesM